MEALAERIGVPVERALHAALERRRRFESHRDWFLGPQGPVAALASEASAQDWWSWWVMVTVVAVVAPAGKIGKEKSKPWSEHS
ncbi:MAG: hypothetical protein AAFU61_17945, partial [Pseudomonadota bacterium]